MHDKKANSDVILADMHKDGTRFTDELLAKKKQKELQQKKIQKLKHKN